ncbi:MAG: molybdate ABC transporter substrate-binding protein [Chloroflexi bacterium]|nr:molybdate ABC transporter substrate-binding protein [Chloroflexota bacterium]MDA1271232.1 molybdate ABC transporter substrate-binding protein [Chloroflexota bacterium]
MPIRSTPTPLDRLADTFTPLLRWVWLPALLVLAAACGGDGGAKLRVFAASSLTEAFTDIAAGFEAENPGITVQLDLGGSQRLRSQLEFGAKADVFASADQLQMDQAAALGLTAGAAVDFASNSLVVIASPGGAVRGLPDLAKPGVTLALAQSNVPVGSYTRQALRNLANDASLGLGNGFDAGVLSNVVSEEPNVRIVAQKVALGEVDAGIVYSTDVPAARTTGDVRVIDIPPGANVSARYPIAALRDASEPGLAQDFIAFVLSEAGQRTLSGYGFGSP